MRRQSACPAACVPSSQGRGTQTAGQRAKRAARPPTRWCGRSPGPQQRWPQRCRQCWDRRSAMPKHQAPRSWRVRYCKREPARAGLGAAVAVGIRRARRPGAASVRVTGTAAQSTKSRDYRPAAAEGGAAAELNTAGAARQCAIVYSCLRVPAAAARGPVREGWQLGYSRFAQLRGA